MHHRFTDQDGDVHSPRDGFWWSHVGWILSTRYKDTDADAIKDFAAYPELRHRRSLPLGRTLGARGYLLRRRGMGRTPHRLHALHRAPVARHVRGQFVSHLVGRRRYATPDTSRNSMLISLVTGGEGWHNNHHYLPASSRLGFTWWEIDPTWYALRALAAVRVVRDLKDPPRRLLDQARVRDGAFDIGMFRSYWERAAKVAGERIADLSARPHGAGG